MFVTNCSNFARFRVFHNLFKVPLKFNYKTTEQVTFLIRLSEYVRTGLLKLGDFQRKNTTAKLKKERKKNEEEEKEEEEKIRATSRNNSPRYLLAFYLALFTFWCIQPFSFPADFPSITFSSRSYKLFNSFLQNSERSFSPLLLRSPLSISRAVFLPFLKLSQDLNQVSTRLREAKLPRGV